MVTQYSDKKIMVVDDEPYNCAAIEVMIKGLELENYEESVTSHISAE